MLGWLDTKKVYSHEYYRSVRGKAMYIGKGSCVPTKNLHGTTFQYFSTNQGKEGMDCSTVSSYIDTCIIIILKDKQSSSSTNTKTKNSVPFCCVQHLQYWLGVMGPAKPSETILRGNQAGMWHIHTRKKTSSSSIPSVDPWTCETRIFPRRRPLFWPIKSSFFPGIEGIVRGEESMIQHTCLSQGISSVNTGNLSAF